MTFPHSAGFTGEEEAQTGDVFARAVLAGVLLDVAERAEPATAARLRAIARREADYVAGAKLARRRGGWSYFPRLPELPPDLDSLAAVMTLFARVAPALSTLHAEPLQVALAQCRPSGGISTWLVDSKEAPAERAAMERGIAGHWGEAVDVDVCARFFRALLLHDAAHYQDAIQAGIGFVLAAQEAHGGWPSTWYFGEVYGNALCIELLEDAGGAVEVVEQGLDRVVSLQRADGGWGPNYTYALDTAVAVWLLARDRSGRHRAQAERGSACLLDLQTAEGFWEGTPWIVMNTGRARGATGPVLRYRSTTLTTAFCVRALLACR